jgi:hypothetical protein
VLKSLRRWLRATPLHPVYVPTRIKFDQGQAGRDLAERIKKARDSLPANNVLALGPTRHPDSER